MKIPKKLKLFGYTWKVIYNPRESEGSFDWKTKVIKIGGGYGEQEAVFFHEIMEAIFVHLLLRFYGNEKSQEFQFHFNHTDFTKYVQTFYQALKDNKIIK
jgi:hypothetical protein